MSPSEDNWDGLSDDEIERYLSGTSRSGDPVEVEGIDRVLYEEEILGAFDGDGDRNDE